jgi:glutamate dehydrogenase (NAD(P)+)
MAEPQNFMRVPDPTPKRTLYTDAMEIFHRAADTIGLRRG